MTAAFDPENSEHQKCKKGIEIGNGLPDIRTCQQVSDALVKAGFEVSSSRA
jgi:sterol 24-C-methyltransferase